MLYVPLANTRCSLIRKIILSFSMPSKSVVLWSEAYAKHFQKPVVAIFNSKMSSNVDLWAFDIIPIPDILKFKDIYTTFPVFRKPSAKLKMTSGIVIQFLRVIPISYCGNTNTQGYLSDFLDFEESRRGTILDFKMTSDIDIRSLCINPVSEIAITTTSQWYLLKTVERISISLLVHFVWER